VVEVRPPDYGFDTPDYTRVFDPVDGPAATRPHLLVQAGRDC
jgi:hypothetical protein